MSSGKDLGPDVAVNPTLRRGGVRRPEAGDSPAVRRKRIVFLTLVRSEVVTDFRQVTTLILGRPGRPDSTTGTLVKTSRGLPAATVGPSIKGTSGVSSPT